MLSSADAAAVAACAEAFGKRSRGLGARWPQLAADLLALLTGLKPAVMLDYYFERARGGAAGAGLGAVGQLLCECRAALADSAAVAEARCVQLGDCVFLLRPSLLRARCAAEPPLFVRLDAAEPGPRWAHAADAEATAALCRAFTTALLAMCDASASAVAGDASALADACGLVSPTQHGWLLGYPCVFLFAAERSAAASASLAGAALRVFQLHGKCAALLQEPAVLLSFSVPEPLLAEAASALHAFSAAAQATAQVGEGNSAWTALTLASTEQTSHAVVL